MLNSNFTLTFDKINENFLVGAPLLEDLSLWWEKTTEANVVNEIKI
jgi:hypothetical protein